MSDIRFIFSPVLLMLLQASLCHVGTADDVNPNIKGASSEGQLAIEGFQYPDFLEAKLWAAEPLLANPVAFGIDEQGRLYVCETFRQQKGVEDNRGHMVWLEDDLALTTVEQRLEMFKKHLGESVVDYTREEDRIRLLEDTDGDGTADKATVFADGFNDALDGTGAGVLAIEGDVYYTCIPKLYKLRDTNSDGKADQQEALQHGYGVRVAFRGHDMHGLILGPDGRIYFSIGDRGYNVTTAEGKHLLRPDTGAVFRCELDGSQLEVFAYGLRNPQELAFDDYGNLFTGDNNSDSGDQARWVYVTEGSDTGWRMYFQYLSDRGPWNRERMWYPYRADEQTAAVQPAYIVPPVVNISDGPSGLVCYPGIGFGDDYRGRFFLADFRGSAGRSGIRHFEVKPQGATFELIDHGWFIQSILATDVDFGYDGRMYITDWVDGWNGPGKGRVYTFTHQDFKHDPLHSSTQIMQADFSQLESPRLQQLCGHADRRVRLRAQLQLVKREAIPELEALTTLKGDQLARLHGIWGLGQLLREQKTGPQRLLQLLSDPDAEIRAQSIKVLGDARVEEAFGGLILAARQGTPREQYFSAIGLGKLGKPEAQPAIIDLLKQNNNEDPALRHAAVMGLVGTASEQDLATLAAVSSPEAVRLGAVVALRQKNSVELVKFLNDPTSSVVVEAARAIHDLDLTEALPALARLHVTPDAPDALLRRVMNANFRLGQPEHAAVVAGMAANQKLSEALRLEAMSQLLMWESPPVLDRVINIYRPLEKRSQELANAAVREHLGAMMSGDAKLTTEAIKLAGKYEVRNIATYLKTIFDSSENSTEMRVAALTALNAVNADNLVSLLETATADASEQVRATARELLAPRAPEKVVPMLAEALSTGTRVERQAAVATLASLNNASADEVLIAALEQFIAGKIAPEIQLDLLLVAQQKSAPDFQTRLQRIEENRDSSQPLANYLECLEGGSVARGRDVFFGNAAASCRRCHKVNGNGSDVGPDLSAVSKENPRQYLLESIVLPNARIAKGFETVVFAMDDGRIVSGIIKSEDEKTYRVMKPMGEVVIIEKDLIDAQAKGQSGMPADMAKQLTKSEIRDLVEYLSTLKTPYKAEGHE